MRTLASMLALSLFAGCGDSGSNNNTPDARPSGGVDAAGGGNLVDVPAGDITASTTWTADNIYTLRGQVFVTGGTLTIEAGTVIQGDPGSVLVITAGAQLNAVGTAAAPIVFTSSQMIPSAGDWGGVVLLGRAPINVTGGTNLVEGFPEATGTKVEYGGAVAAHNCGTLRYARFEYAGFELSTDNELNALTVAGCGSDTEIDFVQMHQGLDDGIEFFGGTASATHLVISQPGDDGVDWDLGWTGKLQFVIVQQKNGDGNNAIEADSNKNNNDALPRSAPEVWNYTFIGGDGVSADKSGGMHLRRGTAGKLSNGIVAYFPTYAIDIDGSSSVAQFESTALSIEHTFFVKSAATEVWPTNFDVDAATTMQNDCVADVCFDEATEIGAAPTNHMGVDPMLTAAKNLDAPNWAPMAASPVMSGCGTPPAGLDTSATFCGAVGATDWTAGWTSFPE